MLTRIGIAVAILALLMLSNTALATDFSSDNFKVKDPVLDTGGIVNSSSESFRLSGSIGQISIGTSSASNFQVKSGFFYFSAATTAQVAVTVTAGGSNWSEYIRSLEIALIKPLIKELKPSILVFDLNGDNKVDLKDFSVFLALTPLPAPNSADFNNDGKVDNKDLSVLLFAWTEKFLTFGGDSFASVSKIVEKGKTFTGSIQENLTAGVIRSSESISARAEKTIQSSTRVLTGVFTKTALAVKRVVGAVYNLFTRFLK